VKDVTETKRYAGGFTYRDADGSGANEEALDHFGHAGERVRYYESGDQLAYPYAFSDHLGNTRVLAEPEGAGVVQTTAYYPYGLQIADLGGGSSTNEELYNGKELTDSHGLGWYHYGARYYDVAVARWTSMDPADEFHSPYVYVGGDPVNLVDPDGMASCDIILCGQNGSSVTIETDLINAEVDVSALPGTDFGGNHTLSGEGVVLAGLDLVGTFDPTPISDGLAASIYANRGNWLDAGISAAGLIPVLGDVGKLARHERHIDAIRSAIQRGIKPKLWHGADNLQELRRSDAFTTRSVEYAYQRLKKHQGISTEVANTRLHNIKTNANLGPADNVIFDSTGGVFSPQTGQKIRILSDPAWD
jgi:RHS repeat-associated protein